MECFFEARPISSDTLRPAYAVALLGFPSLTLPEFRKLVARNACGVMTGLFDRRGYVHALFRSKRACGADQVRVLVIGDLIISDAISTNLGNEMVDAMMLHASKCGCDQLTVMMARLPPSENSILFNMLENLGFSGYLSVRERRAKPV